MTNDGSQKDLSIYYAEEKALVAKLKAVRQYITAFGGVVSNQELQSLLDLEGESSKIPPLTAPIAFEKSLPQISKIAYILKILGGSAYANEIAEKLYELDPPPANVSKENIKRNVSLLCSYLFRDGRIKAQKDGNKHKYILVI